MENLTNTAAHMLEDFQRDELTQGEKSKLSREIVTALIALTCMAAGLLFRLLSPGQAAVAYDETGAVLGGGTIVEARPDFTA